MAEKDHPMQISGPDRIAFGQRLTYFRKEKGYTKQKLSRLLEDYDDEEDEKCASKDSDKDPKIHVYGQNLSIWEKGIKIPNYDNLFKLCYVLGVTADELFKGKI